MKKSKKQSTSKKQVKPVSKQKKYPREESPNRKEEKRVAKVVEETCQDFRCPGEVVSIRRGPVVTEYKFLPYRLTRLKDLKNLHEDLAVRVPAQQVSVQRVPGEPNIAITIPNAVRDVVLFKDTVKNVAAHKDDMIIPINLGVTSYGDPVVYDLTEVGPHALIAGSTGMGKSVLLNSLICSILQIRNPRVLNLRLIDFKMVELMPYSDIPHVGHVPVESTVLGGLNMLEILLQEMERRMANIYYQKCKNIKELHAKLKASGNEEDIGRTPYILLIIDEMADFVLSGKSQKSLFLERMQKLAGKGRAAGIHIIAATQSPSSKVLAGDIKNNFSLRIGLRLPTASASQTIFARGGAEQLLGKGDMYVQSSASPVLVRAHGPFIPEEDIDRTIQAVKMLGYTDKTISDGPIPELDGQTVSSALPVPEAQPQRKSDEKTDVRETTPQIGVQLSRWLRERKLTMEQLEKLPEAQKAALREEFKAWSRIQRRDRTVRF